MKYKHSLKAQYIQRVYRTALPCRILYDLRNSGLFHFRGSRAGQWNHSPSGSTNAISVRIMDNNNNRSAKSTRLVSYANLITIKRPSLSRQVYPASKPVEFCLLNACSVKNKSFVIKDFVVDYNIDVLAITETWLQADISVQLTSALQALHFTICLVNIPEEEGLHCCTKADLS